MASLERVYYAPAAQGMEQLGDPKAVLIFAWMGAALAHAKKVGGADDTCDRYP
jgi:hypothetical protein